MLSACCFVGVLICLSGMTVTSGWYVVCCRWQGLVPDPWVVDSDVPYTGCGSTWEICQLLPGDRRAAHHREV